MNAVDRSVHQFSRFKLKHSSSNLDHLPSELHVQMDVESGHRHGVEETPTAFVSVRHKGTQNLKALMAAITD